MPNRIIKESIHTSEKLNTLTDFQYRLWVGLLTYVDDYGRGDARLPIIKGTVFPLRDRVTLKDLRAALAGLADAGCVSLYEVDGRPYLYLPNWEKHQRIQKKRSEYPAPESGTQSTVVHRDPPSSTVSHRDSPSESNPIQYESESESEYESESESEERNARAARFSPPSVDDVRAYCRDHGLTRTDPQRFVDHYTANGWRVGRSPMKDWRAAARNWEAREDAPPGRASPAQQQDYQRRHYTAEDFRGMETDLSAELAEIRIG